MEFVLLPNVPHFVELEIRRPLPLAVLQEAFQQAGLGHSLLDADRAFERAQPDSPAFVRFLTGTIQPLRLRDVGAGRWKRAWQVRAALFAGLDLQTLSAALRPVKRGTCYDLRFFVKAKRYPTRAAVSEALRESGFREPEALCLMNDKHIHLPDHPATLHQWYARAVWDQGDSALTARDPVLVDEMAEVRADAAPDPTMNGAANVEQTPNS